MNGDDVGMMYPGMAKKSKWVPGRSLQAICALSRWNLQRAATVDGCDTESGSAVGPFQEPGLVVCLEQVWPFRAFLDSGDATIERQHTTNLLDYQLYSTKELY